jgi:cyanobactin maturation PatA/PatG family protease
MADHDAQCGCEDCRGDRGEAAGQPEQPSPVESAGPSTPLVSVRQPLVYALGKIGYDLGSESRRDSLAQHMHGDPGDPGQLLKYLQANPFDAEDITWTLNLGSTPLYAVQPRGAFAQLGYERLGRFLQEQIEEGVERVSIAGTLGGPVRLMSGETVATVWPDLRCCYSWTTGALVREVSGRAPAKSASAEAHEAYARRSGAVAGFLERVYHEFRNRGFAPEERALNYAATNAINVEGIFSAAAGEGLELDTVELEESTVCRLGSDCWDVKLTFYNPTKVLEQARRLYRFTVDVSDVCPVMADKVRSWSVR